MKKLFFLLFLSFSLVFAQVPEPSGSEKCVVCNMDLKPFKKTLSAAKLKDGSIKYTEAPLHLFEFYFANKDRVSQLYVKDYKTGKWIPAENAFYIINENGPMGRDFLAFGSKIEAQKFSKGSKIYQFKDITPKLLEELKTDHIH
ncbi:MAG: nitrous oxide reductase accessory protein NosL [Hydrogenothermaceae bacterium]|nr:nitrous oxide reductase accessory protein NosL [Hydrogenothermaceae bacterium]